MTPARQRLEQVRQRLRDAERDAGRAPGSVALLAVSKQQPASAIADMVEAGQTAFGENYVQEALDKQKALADYPISWHFIGPLQSNKTKAVAENFAWLHTLSRFRIARRLSEQRPQDLEPLNCCLQVRLGGETSKSGVEPEEVPELARRVAALPGLRLRGLMTLPPPEDDPARQRVPFRHLRELFDDLKATGLAVDTLSMGMSGDAAAAIAEGATIVRIGTALFGPRPSGAGTPRNVNEEITE